MFNPNTGYVEPGLSDYTSAVGEIEDTLGNTCAEKCTEEVRDDLYRQSGISLYVPLSEDVSNLKYIIPGAGFVYGAFDSLREGEWTPALVGGASLAGPLTSLTVKGTTMIVGVSLAANGSYQLATKPTSEFSVIDFGLSGVSAWLTQGRGIIGGAGINAATSGVGEMIKGKDPLAGIIGGGFGSVAGSASGKTISNTLKTFLPSGVSNAIGAYGGSVISEAVSDKIQSKTKEHN